MKSFALIILAIISSYCLSCRTVFHMDDAKEGPTIPALWVERPQEGKEKAVVILLHGLNLKPQKMDDWASALRDSGAIVMRLALFGHQAVGPMRDVSAEIWRKQFDQAAKEANRLAKKDGLPLYFMGFSLGALVGLEWLAQSDNDGPKIERMVLVAPALATPWYSKTVLLMFTIFGKGFSLPSRSPKEYRANNGSSLAAYKALFDLINSLKSHNYKNANIPSLVVMDKHDELVPYKAIKQIISERHLGQWKLDIVDNKVAEQNYGFRHLLVDRQSVGQTLFLDIIAKVKQHLRL